MDHRGQDDPLLPGQRHHHHRYPPQQLPRLRGLCPVRDPGVVLRGGAVRPQREGPQPGSGTPGSLPEGGGGTPHPGLPPLPAPLHRLPLPGGHRQAGGVRRAALFLRPPPRPHPQAGHRRTPGRRGLQPGIRGLFTICSQKNRGLRKKGLEI